MTTIVFLTWAAGVALTLPTVANHERFNEGSPFVAFAYVSAAVLWPLYWPVRLIARHNGVS